MEIAQGQHRSHPGAHELITENGRGDPGFGEELAALSLAGRHDVADRSGHHVQYERPELVVGAIRDVLALSRKTELSAKLDARVESLKEKLHVS